MDFLLLPVPILLLLTIVTVVGVINLGFRRSVLMLWSSFSQEIAAACPSCPKDPKYKLR